MSPFRPFPSKSQPQSMYTMYRPGPPLGVIQADNRTPLVRSVHCRMEAALFSLSRGVCVALAPYLGGSWTPSFLLCDL